MKRNETKTEGIVVFVFVCFCLWFWFWFLILEKIETTSLVLGCKVLTFFLFILFYSFSIFIPRFSASLLHFVPPIRCGKFIYLCGGGRGRDGVRKLCSFILSTHSTPCFFFFFPLHFFCFFYVFVPCFTNCNVFIVPPYY
ncbi:hypothetical protein, unlikely [Trypanosoma brucei gambiense DAL972]|uniref:Uncharacterized protein n=1 Tax=Trypanosoma brucei gambiense (strain MHOM/CI/86/DAL972) TaxID=679716 RepID=C9ZT18_TRYB9|nr:hypothetical protein, unlikely [Trypanosoma brucei gambiense DAL972]CBH12553.1 hypothetical protein, unlikely [Trypanosoma brucei gambiense DAL972]|eukprot:XP_011774833.1 hypothetical protein, unlikely [Trypanosoma brucei gambiense DAL972]